MLLNAFKLVVHRDLSLSRPCAHKKDVYSATVDGVYVWIICGLSALCVCICGLFEAGLLQLIEFSAWLIHLFMRVGY